jgi:hypothetical protein
VSPADTEKNQELKSLYALCSRQRSAYWENKLKPEQVKMLDALDFPFERTQAKN